MRFAFTKSANPRQWERSESGANIASCGKENLADLFEGSSYCCQDVRRQVVVRGIALLLSDWWIGGKTSAHSLERRLVRVNSKKTDISWVVYDFDSAMNTNTHHWIAGTASIINLIVVVEASRAATI
jgi:hypothetical protein